MLYCNQKGMDNIPLSAMRTSPNSIKLFNISRLLVNSIVQEKCNRHTKQTRKSPWPIIVKALNMKNKESVLRVAREKTQVTHKAEPIRTMADSPWEL